MIASLREAPDRKRNGTASARGRGIPWGRLIPAALLLAWLAVLLAHLRTPQPSDQLHYLTAADLFPEPVDGALLTHQMTRFGLIVPASVAVEAFGYSQAAYAVVPLLATLSLMLGTYALGTLLFARVVGAAAGVAVVAATPVFADSTDLMPDVLAVGLFTCALALTVAIAGRDGPPGRWRLAGLGALLGWSYLTREFIVFLWPLVPILLYRKAGRRGLAWIAVPIVAMVAAEMLLCWRLYGDPLARLKAAAGHGGAPSPPEIASTYRDKPRSLYLLRLPRTLIDEYPDGRLLVGLIGLTLAGALVWPRRLALLAGAFLLTWVPLTLLGGVIDPSAPKLRLQLIRYWFPIFPAFVLGGLAALWLAATVLSGRLPGGSRARAVVPAVVVLAAAMVVTGVAARSWWASETTRLGGATQMEAFRSWMRDHDRAYGRVWADPRTGSVLMVYRSGPFGGRSWDAPVLKLREGAPFTPRRGDLVVFFDTDGGKLCPRCQDAARRVWGDVSGDRPGWSRVYATGDGVLRVYAIG
ncbi:hypothetical protein Acsp03_30310 [Actinomadura sp. NBRC 104412]|uniref:hypothetical protein n=1 Tax=Actinomadura sp. NBRC 104412 TaxID=3032203 RepID=UPI0024A31D48|nr:hypothetical protein [Actinomadura sp. NBRC 104412]GLZ05565.1 hypothetical protein Acsp03_30310 [Actinomadura sp. NBRC 104412]